MMKLAEIKLDGLVELTYDENSPEFQETLKGYQEVIDPTGTEEDMIKHVAFYVTRFGTDGMVEGVGYVGYNGRIPEGEPYSGIMVGADYDEFTFEIL